LHLTRIIPVLLLKNGQLVRSSNFNDHRFVGDPFLQCQRFNSWDIDEIIYLNIDRLNSVDRFGRSDQRSSVVVDTDKIQEFVSQTCQVPLAWGGNLKTALDAGRAIEVFGADKVIFTSALDENPVAISETAKRFGSQAVCAGVDFRVEDDQIFIYVQSGTKKVESTLEGWIRRAIEFGAGEILLHAIDRDGLKLGFDLVALDIAKSVTNLPIILLGGVGNPGHLVIAAQAGASGVAASNMWHFADNVADLIRDEFVRSKVPIRNP
jgi:cyclase